MAQATNAQIGVQCIDSNRINPWYQCGPTFSPVCGCDNITYRNECLSYNAAGNNQIQSTGVCQNDFYFFDFWPSLVLDRVDIFMQFAPAQSSSATLQIIDTYGNQVYLQLLNNVSSDFPYIESLNLSYLQSGVYIFIIQSKGVYKRQKFVKHDYF